MKNLTVKKDWLLKKLVCFEGFNDNFQIMLLLKLFYYLLVYNQSVLFIYSDLFLFSPIFINQSLNQVFYGI